MKKISAAGTPHQSTGQVDTDLLVAVFAPEFQEYFRVLFTAGIEFSDGFRSSSDDDAVDAT